MLLSLTSLDRLLIDLRLLLEERERLLRERIDDVQGEVERRALKSDCVTKVGICCYAGVTKQTG